MEARDSDSNFDVSVSDLMVNAWRLETATATSMSVFLI